MHVENIQIWYEHLHFVYSVRLYYVLHTYLVIEFTATEKWSTALAVEELEGVSDNKLIKLFNIFHIAKGAIL